VAIRAAAPPVLLTRAEELADRWPAFSPDGQTVVFGRVRAGGEDPAGIWTVDVTGRNLVALSPDGSFPRWLP
jgi:Tol biopolymer transport system component